MKDHGTYKNATSFAQWITDHGISTGNFTDIELGDSITIRNDDSVNKKCIVAGIDNFYNCGISNKHHITLMTTYSNKLAYYLSTRGSVGYLNSNIPSSINNTTYSFATVCSTKRIQRSFFAGYTGTTTGYSMVGANNQGYISDFGNSSYYNWIPSLEEITGATIHSSWYDIDATTGRLPLFDIRPIGYWWNDNTMDVGWLRNHAYGYNHFCYYNYHIDIDSWDATNKITLFFCVG